MPANDPSGTTSHPSPASAPARIRLTDIPTLARELLLGDGILSGDGAEEAYRTARSAWETATAFARIEAYLLAVESQAAHAAGQVAEPIRFSDVLPAPEIPPTQAAFEAALGVDTAPEGG